MKIIMSIVNILLKLNSVILIYFISLLVIFTGASSNILLSEILIFLGIVLCIIRIGRRYYNLKLLNYIHIFPIKFSEDQEERGNQILDISFLALLIASMLNFLHLAQIERIYSILNKYPNEVTLVLLPLVFLPMILYLSIVKNSYFMKAISILITSVQGVFFLIITMLFVEVTFLAISSSFTDKAFTLPSSIFDYSLMLSLPVFIEYNLKYILGLSLISLLFQIFILYLTPPYQLIKLEEAYKILNIYVVCIGMLIFLWSPHIYKFAESHKENLINEIQSEKTIGFEERTKFISDVKEINEGTFTRMISILFVPYTVGTMFVTFILNMRRNRSKKHAKEMLKFLLDNDTRLDIDLVKRIIYYTGDEHDIIFSIMNFKRRIT
ncbi:hypothetical protein [Fusibacter sp. 3D3]|uniref:hypothetical protein n=1 Tax=Fusibacter sp. 3D3 TaxID=1048380 RepID=UPI000857E60A|nr:hypothetical protein [Fusibacter sp. 3D3]GAU76721.1 hypothetical protein F3D3_1318 [Fusibacter sp. 3D3]